MKLRTEPKEMSARKRHLMRERQMEDLPMLHPVAQWRRKTQDTHLRPLNMKSANRPWACARLASIISNRTLRAQRHTPSEVWARVLCTCVFAR